MTAAAPVQSFGTRIRTEFKPRRVVLGAIVLLITWEVAALLFTRGMTHPEYVMPDLWYVARHGVPGLSDYYRGAFGGSLTSEGATQSVGLGVLAVVEHSMISLLRVTTGFLAGSVLGVVLGLLMAAIRPVRLAGFGVFNMLRMLPLLALAPLFTLWFGANSGASIAFIAFVVSLTMIIGTMAAVANLDRSPAEYAQTLGAGRPFVYRKVILPAIIPELCATIVLCVPLAWSVLLASELYGIQNGIGWMMGQSLAFTLVDRITVIAALFIILTFLSLRATQAAARRVTRWTE
ncbi:ABC transporter permease [Mycolicibacterium vaccae]|uniref:ABC transporter permease n=1 Tax=Mycolicibacterium vaccae TaxID=1810 RepID=UPI003CEA8BDF